MSRISQSKFTGVSAVAIAAALLLGSSLTAASAAENKSNDVKEVKPACVENQRNIGTVQFPICVANGASAYEIAVKLGFEGNPSAWLLTLKGAKGDTGAQGEVGTQGVRGEIGPQGIQGFRGEPGSKGSDGKDGQNANVIGTACSFTSSKNVTHTGVWGFGKIQDHVAIFGCVLPSTDNSDD